MSLKHLLSLLLCAGVLFSCTSEKQLQEQISKVISENPKILTDAIEKNPVEFVEAVQKAARLAQDEMGKKREEEEKKKFEDSFNNPLKPLIREDEAFRGPKDAPLVLVEYSDFECPFCQRGYETVMALMKEYPGKITFIYKHLPLSFHQQAMPAAQYYEAIRLQSPEKAHEFHDKVFKSQDKLRMGEKFLDQMAKEVGADMKKLKADKDSEAVMARIQQDIEEAGSFGMSGTPGFLINGIPVKGAYPVDHFKMIIGELVAKGKVKL